MGHYLEAHHRLTRYKVSAGMVEDEEVEGEGEAASMMITMAGTHHQIRHGTVARNHRRPLPHKFLHLGRLQRIYQFPPRLQRTSQLRHLHLLGQPLNPSLACQSPQLRVHSVPRLKWHGLVEEQRPPCPGSIPVLLTKR